MQVIEKPVIEDLWQDANTKADGRPGEKILATFTLGHEPGRRVGELEWHNGSWKFDTFAKVHLIAWMPMPQPAKLK